MPWPVIIFPFVVLNYICITASDEQELLKFVITSDFFLFGWCVVSAWPQNMNKYLRFTTNESWILGWWRSLILMRNFTILHQFFTLNTNVYFVSTEIKQATGSICSVLSALRSCRQVAVLLNDVQLDAKTIIRTCLHLHCQHVYHHCRLNLAY